MPYRIAYLGLELRGKPSLEALAEDLEAACVALERDFDPMPSDLLHCTFLFDGGARRPAEVKGS